MHSVFICISQTLSMLSAIWPSPSPKPPSFPRLVPPSVHLGWNLKVNWAGLEPDLCVAAETTSQVSKSGNIIYT